MKLRCELHLGGHSSKLLLVPRPEEKPDHLALKLAAYAMFLPREPIVEPSADHPALGNLDVKPDAFVLDEGGGISIWIECGEVSLRKLDKVVRRLPEVRVIVLKATAREAERLRADVKTELRQADRVEIWTWPDGAFGRWLAALGEKTELFGEAREKSFNLVVNNVAYAVDLLEV